MILVTGAPGGISRMVLKSLISRRIPARVLAQERERPVCSSHHDSGLSEGLGGVSSGALVGVERILHQTHETDVSAFARLAAFLREARRQGVAHVVNISRFGADPTSPYRFARRCAAAEAVVESSGIAYTTLRPHLSMQRVVTFRPPIGGGNATVLAPKHRVVSAIDSGDVADVAVAALTGRGHDALTYDLTGPEALSGAEMASQLSAALRRAIAYADVPPTAVCRALLRLRLPEWQAFHLGEEYATYRRGSAASVACGVYEALGRPPREFKRFARDYAELLSQRPPAHYRATNCA